MIIQKEKHFINFKNRKKNIISAFILGSIISFSSSASYSMDTAAEEADDQQYRFCCQPSVQPKDFGSASGPRLSMLLVESNKWVNGTRLFYYFRDNDGGNDTQRQAVRDAFKEWEDLGISISFAEVTDPSEAQIKIGFAKGSSWSYIARDALQYAPASDDKSMNFGWDLTTPYGRQTARHEIGHALGFPHEHQSPFAGITWDTDAVYAYFAGRPNFWDQDKTDANVLNKLSPDDVRGSDWDPTSVMHYGFPRGLILNPVQYQAGIPSSLTLSAKDISWVRQFYPQGALDSQPVPLVPYQSATLTGLSNGQDTLFSINPVETRRYTIKTFGPKETDVTMVLFNKADMSTVAAADNSGDIPEANLSADLTVEESYLLRLRLNHAVDAVSKGSVMLF